MVFSHLICSRAKPAQQEQKGLGRRDRFAPRLIPTVIFKNMEVDSKRESAFKSCACLVHGSALTCIFYIQCICVFACSMLACSADLFKHPHSSCGSPHHFHPDSHHLHHTSTRPVCSDDYGTGTHHFYIAVALNHRWRLQGETVVRQNQQETSHETFV